MQRVDSYVHTIRPLAWSYATGVFKFSIRAFLSENDVYPIITDRAIIEKPEMLGLLAQYFIAAAKGGNLVDIETATRLSDAISPGANANQIIRWIDSELHRYLDRIGIVLPNGILATGVYPLKESFRAVAVPRSSGVLILIATGCIEIFEYAISLMLMSDWRTEDQRICLLAKVLRDYVNSSALPKMNELDGPDWNSIKELVYPAVTWAEWFLICHEYGHHALGHLHYGHTKRHEDLHGEFEIIQYAHVKEFEADLWAMSIMIGLVLGGAPPLPTKDGIAFACAAPVFYLKLLEIIDKISGRTSPDYPSAAARILNIDIMMKKCGLFARPYQYLNWSFSNLLDGVSQSISGEDQIAEAQISCSLRRDIVKIVDRVVPNLPVFDDMAGVMEKLRR